MNNIKLAPGARIATFYCGAYLTGIIVEIERNKDHVIVSLLGKSKVTFGLGIYRAYYYYVEKDTNYVTYEL